MCSCFPGASVSFKCVRAPLGFKRRCKSNSALRAPARSAASGRLLRGPCPSPLAQNASSAASHTHRRPAARRLLLRAAVTTQHGHLGRSSGASQRLGRASFTHAATTKLSGPGVESWCELHVRGGCGHSRSTRRASKLAVGVLSWREPRPLQRSRVQWRSRGYQGHQVVALAHSDQGCALVGLCLSMCEVGVRAGGVCG